MRPLVWECGAAVVVRDPFEIEGLMRCPLAGSDTSPVTADSPGLGSVPTSGAFGSWKQADFVMTIGPWKWVTCRRRQPVRRDRDT